MSSTPNRRLQDDGGYSSGSGSGNPGHSSALKFPHDNRGTHSGVSGKVVTSGRHDTHASYDMGQDGQMPKTTPQRNDADRRAPLTPNMLFRVSGSIDSHSDHVASGSKVEFRDLKDTSKEIRAVNHEMKSDAKELQQSAKCDKYDINQSDDGKYGKHERDTYSELKGDTKLDKDCFDGSNKQLNWKDFKEQNRMKQFPDANSGNVETWHTSSTGFHGPAETAKEGPRIITRDFAEAREAVGENKVDMKGDDNFKEKDRKRKEIRHRDWGEKSDRRNNMQLGGSSGENKEVVKEEREFERWGTEKKDPLREKEKLTEKEKDHIKKEAWNGSDKEASHNEKEPVDTLNKSMEPESGTLEMKKKDHDAWRNVDRAVRDRKKEKDIGIESDRADRRISHHEMETEDHGMDAEGGTEREREAFSSGVQQRKRMLRPRGSPQMGNHDPRFGLRANDIEGPQGKAEVSSVVYKIGECMQELIKLWKEFEISQANEERSQIGPTLEIRIPAEHVTATNRQVRGGQLWGTDIYTVDSDLVAVLMHVGYCRPTASPPPPTIQEFRATVRVLPPQECYISTLRNNVRSRAWGAAIGCSYLVERCCIVKKGGGIINLEPCLMHSSTMEPTLAPVAVERTMTTRAAASNALRQQKFVREVTIQFNLCMEPWLKYSISAVADKGLKKSLFTSSRLKKGEVLYVETHSCRFELCFKGERISKTAETGKTQVSNVQPITVDRNGMDVDTVVDMFRWSRCKRPLPQATMRNIGIPLPPEHVVVLEENLEWENILWSQTGVRIGGREYHLARVHFLAPN